MEIKREDAESLGSRHLKYLGLLGVGNLGLTIRANFLLSSQAIFEAKIYQRLTKPRVKSRWLKIPAPLQLVLPLPPKRV